MTPYVSWSCRGFILGLEKERVTITVPVVYMARDIIILMRENPFRGHWKGWALKIETFLGLEMAKSEASAIWARKGQDFQAHPFQWPK